MSNPKDRATARLPMVPEVIAAGYAAAMESLPRVKLAPRRVSRDRDLPAVSSFG